MGPEIGDAMPTYVLQIGMGVTRGERPRVGGIGLRLRRHRRPLLSHKVLLRAWNAEPEREMMNQHRI